MLPDTLHKLTEEDRYAYAKLLAYMTRVDGELDFDELAVFEQRLGTTLLSPSQRKEIRSYLKNPPTLKECLENMSTDVGRFALRDAALMSAADGKVDDDERKVLSRIARHFGYDDSVVEDILDWVIDGYTWLRHGHDILHR